MAPPTTIVGTQRLLLRQLTEADVPAIATVWTDPEITRFMGGPRDFEKVCAALRDAISAPPSPLDLWPVVERSSGFIVGECGLLPKEINGRDEVELVYLLVPEVWGRGYATEAAAAVRNHAFQKLAIARLVSLIDPAHAASERVALKLGMKFESETIRPIGRTMRIYVINA